MTQKSGLTLARNILLVISMCVTLAGVVIMIVQAATEHRKASGYTRFDDNYDMPF